MTKQKWINAVYSAFAEECAEDLVGLWAILWKVQRLRPRSNEQELRDTTLEIVRRLIETENIVAGHPTANGEFVTWDESPREVIQRIEREWLNLGRLPDVGDIVWFARRDLVGG